jgi:hypothetical protein
MCIQDHRSLLGNAQSGVMNLNDADEMVDAAWLRIPMQFPTIQLDEHITMPNHFHGIIQIIGRETVGVPLVGTRIRGRTGPQGRHKACPYSAIGTEPVRDVGAPLVGARMRGRIGPQGRHKACPYSAIGTEPVRDVGAPLVGARMRGRIGPQGSAGVSL